MKRIRGFTLIELMIVVAIIAIIAAIAIPSILRSRISANQTSAVASLDTIVKMNNQFRSNDEDQNGDNDYWSENVYGMYGVQSAGGDRIELFSKSVATADYEGTGTSSGSSSETDAIDSNQSNFSIDSFNFDDLSPKSGYYVSMFVDQAASGASCNFGSSDCYDDGDADGGTNCANSGTGEFTSDNRFGAMAFPELYDNTGTKAYAVSEGGDKFEIDAKSSDPASQFNGSDDSPSSSEGTAPVECLPADDNLDSNWGTVG